MQVAVEVVSSEHDPSATDVLMLGDASPLDELAEFGGLPTGSAAEAAEGADAAVVIVLTADEAEEAVFGRDGLVKSLPQGSPVVCMSTMSPARARSLAQRAEAAVPPAL